MKKNSLIGILALGFILFSNVSCDDAKNTIIENGVYIAEAASSTSQDVMLTDGNASFSVFARLAKTVSQDVTIELGLNTNYLDDYNRRNLTEYEGVPDRFLTYPAKVTIPAGSLSVEIPVTINEFNGEAGVDYAIPLAILNSNSIDVSERSSNYLVMLSNPLIQKVPSFRYENNTTLLPESDPWGEACDSFTLEWLSRVTGVNDPEKGFSVNNQAIFNAISTSSGEGSDNELYIRFGDLIYSKRGGSGYLYNFLQVKAMGSQFDTGDPNDYPLVSGQWYHFAITWTSSTGIMILYKDGQQVGLLDTGRTTPYVFEGMNMIVSGSTYFKDNVEMAQVRLWKTVRSQQQIEKFMHKEVKYTDPNLIFYLPMNEGDESANILEDVTGNGHDMAIGNKGSRNTAFAWSEYNFTEL